MQGINVYPNKRRWLPRSVVYVIIYESESCVHQKKHKNKLNEMGIVYLRTIGDKKRTDGLNYERLINKYGLNMKMCWPTKKPLHWGSLVL